MTVPAPALPAHFRTPCHRASAVPQIVNDLAVRLKHLHASIVRGVVQELTGRVYRFHHLDIGGRKHQHILFTIRSDVYQAGTVRGAYVVCGANLPGVWPWFSSSREK